MLVITCQKRSQTGGKKKGNSSFPDRVIPMFPSEISMIFVHWFLKKRKCIVIEVNLKTIILKILKFKRLLDQSLDRL